MTMVDFGVVAAFRNSRRFDVAVSFIEPAIVIDPHFMGLMVHTAKFEWMQRSSSSSGSYGHRTISRDVITMSFGPLRGRFRSLTQDEIEASGRAGEVIDDYIWYAPYGYIPDRLRDPKFVTEFRLADIRALSGEAIDAGPFDIQSARLIAGEVHHYQLRIRKVT